MNTPPLSCKSTSVDSQWTNTLNGHGIQLNHLSRYQLSPLCFTQEPSQLALPFSPAFPKNSTFPGKCLHFHRFTAFSSLSGADDQKPSQKLAVLLEVDGVLMDAYHLGNRPTFNVAFKKLGLDYANWTEPVYLDLLKEVCW